MENDKREQKKVANLINHRTKKNDNLTFLANRQKQLPRTYNLMVKKKNFNNLSYKLSTENTSEANQFS